MSPLFLIEKYGAHAFSVDCREIEVYEKGSNGSMILKGPGSMEGSCSGKISFRLHNQLPLSVERLPILKRLSPQCTEDPLVATIVARDYEGTEWTGGWCAPKMSIFEFASSQQFMVYGEFSQLSTRVKKVEGDRTLNTTELVFVGQLSLPYEGRYRESTYRGDDEISTRWRRAYHQLDHRGATITFEESEDQTYTRVRAQHRDDFAPPFVENWVSESIRFVTAKRFHPRMVIRHFEDDSLVFIRETYSDVATGVPSPFLGKFRIEKDAWEGLSAYLSKCEENTLKFLKISSSFSELMAASTGNVQGLLISLVAYIEGVVQEVYLGRGQYGDCINSARLSELQSHVEKWQHYKDVEKRIGGLLNMLTKPPTHTFLRDLVKRRVIKPAHKGIWSKVRGKLMHGGLIEMSKAREYRNYSNHLISMAHRLTLSFVGYQGRVLDYDDDSGFKQEEFEWEPLKSKPEQRRSRETEGGEG